MKEYIKKVSEGEKLTPDEAEDAMKLIMNGESTDAQNGAFLTALKIKGESPEEIAAFAKVMREYATKINPKVKGRLVDVCGTGGDHKHTINISTTSMFIVAGAGVNVAKHGNRSITSKSGSADLLEALGARIELEPEMIEKCIEDIGLGFMFAPKHHPAMKHVMPARKQIGIRTVFNILGPLTNPANAQAQLMGVFDPTLTDRIAEVFRILGSEQAIIVNGEPGLDELSTIGRTRVSELKDGVIESYRITPEELGLKKASIGDITGSTPEENAKITGEILSGKENGAKTDIVMLNAAGGIIVGGKAGDFKEGLDVAREAIESGKALEKLEEFIEYTNR
ncbi:MAG: anthranilate phosphoribosyltransferase [Candidatus Altiarchaeota archaeon]